MTYRVTMQSSHYQFDAEEKETILEAAIRQNIPLPYGCRNGLCGQCKCQVLAGQIKQDTYAEGTLKPAEIQDNIVLLCRSHADSDLRLQSEIPNNQTVITPKIVTVQVKSIDRFHRVALVNLALPNDSPFVFYAGQYINVILKDGSERSFSIANSPYESNYIELHVRHRLNGKFSDYVFSDPIEPGEFLQIRGPMGDFTLKESSKPILFVCSGTGFAPIQSIIGHMIKLQSKRAITLYRGARDKNDLYLNKRIEAWQSELANFRYIPILSASVPIDHWVGRTGYVHQAVLNDFTDLSNYQAYVCGGQTMVESVYQSLLSKGLPDSEFYSDTFFMAPKIQHAAVNEVKR